MTDDDSRDNSSFRVQGFLSYSTTFEGIHYFLVYSVMWSRSIGKDKHDGVEMTLMNVRIVVQRK